MAYLVTRYIHLLHRVQLFLSFPTTKQNINLHSHLASFRASTSCGCEAHFRVYSAGIRTVTSLVLTPNCNTVDRCEFIPSIESV